MKQRRSGEATMILLHVFFLLYFLLQLIESRCRKELPQGDFKGITQFFDRNGAGILTFSIQNAFDSGLRNSR